MPDSDTGSGFARETRRLDRGLARGGRDRAEDVSRRDPLLDQGPRFAGQRHRHRRRHVPARKTVAPGIGWLSEESADDLERLDSERIFIVDPIDGTRSYLAGPRGLVDLRGACRKRTAGRGRSLRARARRNYVAVGRRRRDPQRLADPCNRTAPRSRAPALPGRRNIWIASRLAPAAVAMPKIHSLALRFARVASGQIDVAFASVNARDWDLAAADLLVHEAGGAMTGVSGEPLVYNLQIWRTER